MLPDGQKFAWFHKNQNLVEIGEEPNVLLSQLHFSYYAYKIENQDVDLNY